MSRTIESRDRLPERLEAITSWVRKGVRLCDVGCDHGYLPIALCREGIISSALAMDVRPGPLESARRHVQEAGLEERIELRLSDGLQQFRAGEADTLVITGMGGRLIARILTEAGARLSSLQDLILGPQSEIPFLRQTLQDLHWGIREEQIVEENGKRYVFLHAEQGVDRPMTPEEIAFGPCLLQARDPLLKEELEARLQIVQTLLEKLTQESGPRARGRCGTLREEEAQLRAVLEYYAM